MVDLFFPTVSKKAIREVVKVLKSKWIGQGDKIEEFEKAFCEKIGQKYCVAVNSCTSALHLAYILAGINKGDEVISPVLTCTATHHPLKLLGAKIVFADIRKDDLCIDAEDVSNKITPKTKAIVVVHLGGYKAKIDRKSVV